MGMVVVALLAARPTTAPTPTMMSTLSPTSSAAKAGSLIDPPVCPARFDDDVPALDIAEFVKALPEFPQRAIGRGGRGGRASAEKPHTRHLARLLRPGEGNAKDASKSEYHGARGLLEVHGNPSFLSHLQQTLGRAAELIFTVEFGQIAGNHFFDLAFY